MKLRCHHCKHIWEYNGKSLFYVTCPTCHYSVNIKKARIIDESNQIQYKEPKLTSLYERLK